MNYRLPFLNIVAASMFFAWTNKAEFFRAIALPTLALVVVWGVWAIFLDDLPSYFSWILFLAYGLSFSFLAVTCHRLILVDEADRKKSFNARPGYRELRFLLWVVVIYAITSLLEFPTLFLASYVPGGMIVSGDGKIAGWVKEIASIPAIYVLARLSLTFPAAAIDKNSGLNWSWARTQGNGWRIFAVVGLFPWLAEMVFGLLWRADATIPEQVLLSIRAYVGLSIEIVALSFTYKELAKHYATDQQSTSGGIVSPSTNVLRDSFHDLAPDSKGQKLFVAVKVAVGLAMAYLVVGSLDSYFVDCNSELISRAASPGGSYKAEVLNKTCKDKKHEGVFLDIAKSSTPRTIYSYPLSGSISKELDLAWTSENRLIVKYAGALDFANVPATYDDVQIVFQKKD